MREEVAGGTHQGFERGKSPAPRYHSVDLRMPAIGGMEVLDRIAELDRFIHVLLHDRLANCAGSDGDSGRK